MLSRLILFMIVIVTVLGGTASAEHFAKIGTFGGQFARIPVDARGEAMGLATTVNPIGPTAFWWNPAPLPETDRVMASYTIREYIADIRWRPLAVRASRGNLTFGYLWGPMRMDPMLVRPAYDPDGDGEYFEAGSDLHQFSFAADCAPWIAAGPSAWNWTVGANARYHHQRLAENTATTWDADIGSSLAWQAVDSESIRLRVHGTAMVRNLFASEFSYDGVTAKLPRYYHFGLGVDVGFGSIWRRERMVVVTVAHTWRRDLEDMSYAVDNELVGFEVLVGGIAAIRTGRRDSITFFSEGWSWGAGLQYRFDVWWGIRAAVDYASTRMESYGLGTMDHFTFTAGFDLP